jgi:hypothetical protein
MYGTHNLAVVLRMQAELRRDAAQARRAAIATKHENRKPDARRVLGLRLSLA